MAAGPLGRIMRGEPSPPLPKFEKPKKPSSSERKIAKAALKALKKMALNGTPKSTPKQKKAPSIPPLPARSIMKTRIPENFDDALIWIGQKLARQIAKIPDELWVRPGYSVKSLVTPNKTVLEIVRTWMTMFDVQSQPATRRSRYLFWLLYEWSTWLHKKSEGRSMPVSMSVIAVEFETEMDRIVNRPVVEESVQSEVDREFAGTF